MCGNIPIEAVTHETESIPRRILWGTPSEMLTRKSWRNDDVRLAEGHHLDESDLNNNVNTLTGVMDAQQVFGETSVILLQLRLAPDEYSI